MEKSLVNTISKTTAKHQLPVEVIGADLDGQQFFEEAWTVTIHRGGVSILLENRLGPDSEAIVRNPETNQEVIAFSVGQFPDKKIGRVYGLAFVDPMANPWRIEFPDAEEAKTVQLECGGCRSVLLLSLSDIELEIFEASREVMRYCKSCRSFQPWREARREAKENKPAYSRGHASNSRGSELTVEPARDSSSEDRRRNRRAGMKTSACIRFNGGEFVVACEDISKGGFRFTGRKEFPQGTRVETAAPYTESGNNIFTSASIIYCHKMPSGLFRHGVSYIKNRRSIGWEP